MQLASLIRNETGLDNAPTVVLLHGVFGRARNLGILQRALSPYFNTVAFDLRCHGESDHAPISYPEMAKDVLESMDALGIEKAHLVGHSMGGKTAMATTLTAPERIEKLLIADIAPDTMIHGQHDLAQQLYHTPLPALSSHAEIRKFLHDLTDDPSVGELIAQHITPGDPAQWNIGVTDIVASFPVIQEWPVEAFSGKTWDGPALFIRGGDSPYIKPHHHAVIQDYFPKAEVKTIPNTGHWLHVEDAPSFNAMMLDFFRG
ncbi:MULTISPECIES: alpha/beta fold hydrolase [Bombella]|uniref:Alpha/beta fold hydrolase n=2 Tax=Bombella TaxID=1654741 RepID=A0ABT3WIX7_9PROT|nr:MULTISPECIES: alpha/beta fold hydrolase [Bombella]MCT6854825.1 alpha/beta fold hydrolase [Bombella apis]PHI96774.1 hypothetical protein BG621_03340 [Parasaccharibacter apium]MCX5614594.1 alpha/beta fold hydrolase [Bombella saccharophila]MCX5619057.1 alpha/beta fold hydrolase [Bombella pollinis]MUG05419.1 alpha/beta fold hydrolase [Bombella sp. ESL0378]